MTTQISGTTGVSQVQDGVVTDAKLNLAANSQEVKDALNAAGTAPIYACRAWVNFNGTGTVAIRASGNVAGVTDNGTGDYTITFATAMSDANYSTVLGGNPMNNGTQVAMPSLWNYNVATSGAAAGSIRVLGVATGGGGVNADLPFFNAAIFR